MRPFAAYKSSMVCLSVGHIREPCKSGWTDWDGIFSGWFGWATKNQLDGKNSESTTTRESEILG